MSDLECKKPRPCEPAPAPAPVPCSEPFDLCVGDRTLKWDGFCLTLDRPRRTPDGTYTSVTVVDGCIVGYGYAGEATYTPPYCNPNPSHCQETGAAGGSSVPTVRVMPSPDNALTMTSGGLFARTYVQGGRGVVVGGQGTLTSPYTVSVDNTGNGASVAAVVGRNGLVSETTSNGVAYVGLERSGVRKGVYDISDQFTVDEFGRITSVTTRTEAIVVAGEGLEARKDGDSIQIGHPTFNLSSPLVVGGYTLAVTNTGHIVGANRTITLEEGIYNLGAYHVQVNKYGSVISIKQRTDVMPEEGEFRTVDNKVLRYDVTGRLVGVEEVSGEVDYSARPLRDMYKIVPYLDEHNPPRKEAIFGTDVQVTGSEGVTRITLPSYVTNRGQITVNHARSWEFVEGVLTVYPDGGDSFTVVLRG